MELEQRVRALELELKVLKNEVQRTLLDVQDQVLQNERPVVATAPKPSISKVRAIEPSRAKQPAASAPAVPDAIAAPVRPAAALLAAPAAPTAIVTPTVPVAQAIAAAPVFKKVSLEELREIQRELDVKTILADSVAVEMPVELVQKPDLGTGERINDNAATLAERGGVKLLEWLMSSATKVNGERDEKHVNEVFDKLTQLNTLVDRASSMEEALRLIEEAKLG